MHLPNTFPTFDDRREFNTAAFEVLRCEAFASLREVDPDIHKFVAMTARYEDGMDTFIRWADKEGNRELLQNPEVITVKKDITDYEIRIWEEIAGEHGFKSATALESLRSKMPHYPNDVVRAAPVLAELNLVRHLIEKKVLAQNASIPVGLVSFVALAVGCLWEELPKILSKYKSQ